MHGATSCGASRGSPLGATSYEPLRRRARHGSAFVPGDRVPWCARSYGCGRSDVYLVLSPEMQNDARGPGLPGHSASLVDPGQRERRYPFVVADSSPSGVGAVFNVSIDLTRSGRGTDGALSRTTPARSADRRRRMPSQFKSRSTPLGRRGGRHHDDGHAVRPGTIPGSSGDARPSAPYGSRASAEAGAARCAGCSIAVAAGDTVRRRTSRASPSALAGVACPRVEDRCSRAPRSPREAASSARSS